jgi:ABC-type Zn2+ transport system substrate-binding protein/surface adhesin
MLSHRLDTVMGANTVQCSSIINSFLEKYRDNAAFSTVVGIVSVSVSGSMLVFMHREHEHKHKHPHAHEHALYLNMCCALPCMLFTSKYCDEHVHKPIHVHVHGHEQEHGHKQKQNYSEFYCLEENLSIHREKSEGSVISVTLIDYFPGKKMIGSI